MLFIGLRFTLAAVAVSSFALKERHTDRRSGRPVRFSASQGVQVLLVGVVFFTAMSLQQVGLLAASVTNAGFLTCLYVVIVPILVAIVLRERQHWIVWPAALACVLGIYLLGGAGFTGLTWGDGLVIVCALFWAIQITLIGKTVQHLGRPVQIATAQFAVCGVLGFIGHVVFMGIPHTRAVEPGFTLEAIRGAALEIFYAAVFAGGLAFSLQAIGQRYTREADAAILLSSEALFAGLFGACLLDERLLASGYLGCAIIFAAIVAVQVAPPALRPKHRDSEEPGNQPAGGRPPTQAELA